MGYLGYLDGFWEVQVQIGKFKTEYEDGYWYKKPTYEDVVGKINIADCLKKNKFIADKNYYGEK